MKRILGTAWTVCSSRVTPPVVMGIFLLIYIVIAFFTDETLITLIGLTKKSALLALLFAVLPLNSAARLVVEGVRHFRRNRALALSAPPDGLFEETVELPAGADPGRAEERLKREGYRTRRTGSGLAAWRGIGSLPARLLYLAGTLCLFAGILISLTTRTSLRSTVVEGDPLLDQEAARVEKISLREGEGSILAKNLELVVTGPEQGARRVFGIYPPSRFQGSFVYPRYLGVGLLLRFSAPDLPGGVENTCILHVIPPGKEDGVAIPGSPYRLVFTLDAPADGSDPYQTGKMVFQFKLLKGKEMVFTGSAPVGGVFAKDGYRIELPDSRRVVITDFIRDYGVTLIWTAFFLFIAAALFFIPVALFFPRREMLFRVEGGRGVGCSRAEGGRRRHSGIFQETLDFLESGRTLESPRHG